MKSGVLEIEVREDTTVAELLDELGLSSAHVLVEVGGEIFYPDEIRSKILNRGDMVTVLPAVAGG